MLDKSEVTRLEEEQSRLKLLRKKLSRLLQVTHRGATNRNRLCSDLGDTDESLESNAKTLRAHYNAVNAARLEKKKSRTAT